MSISAKLTAEERFTAAQKKTRQALTETHTVQQERAARTVRLRNLRLAREAADRDDAAVQAADTVTKS